jgi:hypothetical protein
VERERGGTWEEVYSAKTLRVFAGLLLCNLNVRATWCSKPGTKKVNIPRITHSSGNGTLLWCKVKGFFMKTSVGKKRGSRTIAGAWRPNSGP